MKQTQSYHWQQLNPASLPTPQRGSALAFDQKRQQTVLVVAGQTWLWNGQTWQQVTGAVMPPARNSTHLTYDSLSECILLFGGIGLDGTPLHDVWLWNGMHWSEAMPADFPPSVGGAALACDESQQQVLLFGGLAGFDGLNGSHRTGTLSDETWLWDGHNWTQLNPAHVPPARMGGQLVYNPLLEQTLLFGGISSRGYSNDLWSWDGTDWQQIQPTTVPPANARFQGTYHAQLQQVMLLAENMSGDDPWLHQYQIWTWNGQNWTPYGDSVTLPGSIQGLAYDFARQQLVTAVVSGGKMPMPSKSQGGRIPSFVAPTLASQTWIWGL
jgi:hypothetical protein